MQVQKWSYKVAGMHFSARSQVMMSSARAKFAVASPPDLVHLKIQGRRNNFCSAHNYPWNKQPLCNIKSSWFEIFYSFFQSRKAKKPFLGCIPMTLSSIGWPQNIKQIKGGLCWPCVLHEKEEGREQENTKMKGISLLMTEMSK